MARDTLEFDDREVQRALKDLGRVGIPKVSAGALNRTAFEMRDAEAAHARRVFEFAGQGTRRFQTSAPVFRGESPARVLFKSSPERVTRVRSARVGMAPQISDAPTTP